MTNTLRISIAAGLLTAGSLYAADIGTPERAAGRETENEGAEPEAKVVHAINPDSGTLHASRPRTGNGISYHGGPLILGGSGGGVDVYLIWYGNWSGNTATNIISDFLHAEGGSPY